MDAEVDHQAQPNIDLSHDPVNVNEESIKPGEETHVEDDATHITDVNPKADEKTVEINEDFAAGDSVKLRKKSMKRSSSQPADNLSDKDECQDDEGDNNELSTEMDNEKEELKEVQDGSKTATEATRKPMNIIRQGISFILLLLALIAFNQLLVKVILHFFGTPDDSGKGKTVSSVYGPSNRDQKLQEPEFAEFDKT